MDMVGWHDSAFVQAGSTKLDKNKQDTNTGKTPARKGYAQLDVTHIENVVKFQLQFISTWSQ